MHSYGCKTNKITTKYEEKEEGKCVRSLFIESTVYEKK